MMLLEFLNVGLSEIIILFFLIIFIVGFIWSIFFIVRTVFRKKNEYRPNVFVKENSSDGGTDGNLSKDNEKGAKTEMTLKEAQASKIALPQQSEIKYVEVSQIIRCEADDNYTKFVLEEGDILVSKSLKEYDNLLRPKGFMRAHQSHLVNPNFVKSWLKEDGGLLLLKNNEKIPVSKPNRELIKTILATGSI